MTHGEIATGVNAFVALLAAALLLSLIAERAGVPGAVLLVAAGIAAGSIWHLQPPFNFSAAILLIFLPPLIFEAAWNVPLDELRKAWKPIAFLALPGTLIVAFAIATGLWALHVLPFGVALLFGAMVSATDPVAVIAVFRKFPVPARLKTIVEAESLSNDGVSLVLYGTALVLATGGSVDWFSVAGHAVVSIAGAIGIGYVLALVANFLLHGTAAAEYEVTTTVALAYIAYLVADRLSLSGIFACATAGIVLRAYQQRHDMIDNVDDADRFWNTTAYIANAIVFISTGLLIDFPRIINEPLLIGAAIVIIFVSRAILVSIVLPGRAARLTAFIAGMRGSLPLALALALPETLAHRAEIIDAVFATVFVTLVVQGFPLESVIKRMFPAPNEAVSR